MREREREFLIIPSRICFGLGVGYFLTKGCCGFLSICERCLVRGGESFKELDFIWDVAFTFISWVDKLWWSAPQWMTPCLSEKPMVCEAQCLMIFFFFFFVVDSVYSLAWKRLRNSIALVLQFPWMSKVLTQDEALCEVTSISFWAICVRAHTIFSLGSCLWTLFTPQKRNS